MNKYFTLKIILLLGANYCLAQNNFGPRLTAMGNNGAVVKDIWSIEANPSAITEIKSASLSLNYTKYFFDSELSKQGIAVILPIKNNILGFSFQRYGIAEYNQIKAGFALAKKFGNRFSLAVKGNYHQIKISNYGATTGFSVDVGATYQLNKMISFGTYINNPSLQKYSNKAVNNTIPTVINIGASYQASNKLLIATTISRDIKQPLDVGLGIEYKLHEILILRGGLTAKPFKQYAGFGINYKKIMVDFAVESDLNLGYIPQIALAYAF